MRSIGPDLIPPLGLLLRAGLSMVAASLVAFFLLHLAPGEPAALILGALNETASEEQVAQLRRLWGLDRPLPMQYLAWLGRAVRFDFGRSLRTGEDVAAMILDRLPATLELAGSAFLFLVALSLAFGMAAAFPRNALWDRLGRVLAVLATALPNYGLGLLLLYAFALSWGLFPVFGRGGWNALVLPTVTLGLSAAAGQGRILRALLCEVLAQDFVRFARAKGLRRRTVLLRHVLRGALPRMLALWGLSFGRLLGGAVIVESVFAWPGLGKLAVEAVIARDIPVVQGVLLFMTLAFVLVNAGVDWLHGRLSPRIAGPEAAGGLRDAF